MAAAEKRASPVTPKPSTAPRRAQGATARPFVTPFVSPVLRPSVSFGLAMAANPFLGTAGFAPSGLGMRQQLLLRAVERVKGVQHMQLLAQQNRFEELQQTRLAEQQRLVLEQQMALQQALVITQQARAQQLIQQQAMQQAFAHQTLLAQRQQAVAQQQALTQQQLQTAILLQQQQQPPPLQQPNYMTTGLQHQQHLSVSQPYFQHAPYTKGAQTAFPQGAQVVPRRSPMPLPPSRFQGGR